MMLKKKDDQSVDTSAIIRGNKILTGGNMGTKCGAETEGKAIQRLSHLGIHRIYKSPNPDTIVDTNKCLLTGALYSYLPRGSARA